MAISSFSKSLKWLIGSFAVLAVVSDCVAQQIGKPTKEPVYRIGKTNSDTTLASGNEAENVMSHANTKLGPFERALDLANQGLEYIQNDIRDYSAIMVKRERIDGKIGEPEFIQVKIRNRRPDENIPFGVYMKFLKPSRVKGREVIWVEGRNDNKLIAHEGSMILGGFTANLDPDGFMAMKGNRHPIYEAGIEYLVSELIEKGERDRRLGEAEVKFYENTKINGRTCTLVQVKHDEEKAPYEFHVCRVFIDDEMRIPIRYAGYGWPKTPGGKPTLEEEYTYLNVKLNVGLTDRDFDPKNPEYNYK